MKVSSKGLSIGSIFKLSFIGFSGFFIVAYVVTIITGLVFPPDSGAPGFTINGESPTSMSNWWALLIAFPFMVVIWGGITGLALFVGQWVFTRFKPIELDFIENTN